MYKLPKFLCPNLKTELIRLGKPNDGGYSLSEKSLKKVNPCIPNPRNQNSFTAIFRSNAGLDRKLYFRMDAT